MVEPRRSDGVDEVGIEHTRRTMLKQVSHHFWFTPTFFACFLLSAQNSEKGSFFVAAVLSSGSTIVSKKVTKSKTASSETPPSALATAASSSRLRFSRTVLSADAAVGPVTSAS